MEQIYEWYQKPERKGWEQFLILLGLFCAGLLTAFLAAGILMLTYYGFSGLRSIDASHIPYSIMILLAVIQDVFLFALPAILFGKIVQRRKDFLYANKKSRSWFWIVAVVIAFAALPVSDLLGTLTEKIPLSHNWTAYFKQKEKDYYDEVSMILNFKSISYLIVSIIMIALLPAIAEELFFRGALQQVMIKWTNSVAAGIVISAVIFSAFHFSYYGFLSRAMLGVVLGIVYYYGKNIWLNILMHFINNASAIIGYYLTFGSKPLDFDSLNNDNNSSPWYVQLIGVVVLITVLNVFIKKSKQPITNHTS